MRTKFDATISDDMIAHTLIGIIHAKRYDDIPPSPDLTPEQERRYMMHGVGEFIERAALPDCSIICA